MLSNVIGFIMMGATVAIGGVLFVKAAALEKEIAAESSANDDDDEIEDKETSDSRRADAEQDEELE